MKVLITNDKLYKLPNTSGPENIKGAKINKFLIQCFALIKFKIDNIISKFDKLHLLLENK